MKNLVFVIWMLGYSITYTFSQYVYEYLLKRTGYDNPINAAVQLVIWIGIGVLLYEKTPKKKE